MNTPDAPFVDIRDLTVTFTGGKSPVKAVNGVTLAVKRGEVVALIGESGSGKSVTLRSILRLHNPARSKIEGQILINGQDVVQLSNDALSRFRGKVTSMIFQEPLLALDPVYTVGGGVSISPDGGTSWTTYTQSEGLGSNKVLSVYALGSTVYAGEYGGGLSIGT